MPNLNEQVKNAYKKFLIDIQSEIVNESSPEGGDTRKNENIEKVFNEVDKLLGSDPELSALREAAVKYFPNEIEKYFRLAKPDSALASVNGDKVAAYLDDNMLLWVEPDTEALRRAANLPYMKDAYTQYLAHNMDLTGEEGSVYNYPFERHVSVTELNDLKTLDDLRAYAMVHYNSDGISYEQSDLFDDQVLDWYFDKGIYMRAPDLEKELKNYELNQSYKRVEYAQSQAQPTVAEDDSDEEVSEEESKKPKETVEKPLEDMTKEELVQALKIVEEKLRLFEEEPEEPEEADENQPEAMTEAKTEPASKTEEEIAAQSVEEPEGSEETDEYLLSDLSEEELAQELKIEEQKLRQRLEDLRREILWREIQEEEALHHKEELRREARRKELGRLYEMSLTLDPISEVDAELESEANENVEKNFARDHEDSEAFHMSDNFMNFGRSAAPEDLDGLESDLEAIPEVNEADELGQEVTERQEAASLAGKNLQFGEEKKDPGLRFQEPISEVDELLEEDTVEDAPKKNVVVPRPITSAEKAKKTEQVTVTAADFDIPQQPRRANSFSRP